MTHYSILPPSHIVFQERYLWGEAMYKRFWLIGVFFISGCGFVLHIAYETSGAAAWSLIISGVNLSPWELMKPFVLVYIMWTFIELSVLRPSLLHYVCGRMLSLIIYMIVSLCLLSLIYCFIVSEWLSLSLILLTTLLSQAICSRLYRSHCRTELFWMPLLAALAIVLACILLFSFYPPQFPFFLDPLTGKYGLAI